MKNELKVFEYEGKSITFDLGNGDVMVNATDMARTFGKEVRQWFDNVETHAFIHALADHKGLPPQGLPTEQKRTSLNTSALADVYPSLITVVRGGVPGSVQQGTWMHEDVAIEFARWLSPMFAIWCNDRIKELMKTGTTSIYSVPRTFSEALQLAADQAKELESKKEEIALLDKLVDTMEPKVKVYNQISDSETLLSLNDAAKSIGMGRNKMMKDLRGAKILRVNNVPYQSYIDRELFEVKIKSIAIGRNQKNYAQTFVTGKGLTWLSKRYPKNEDKETTPKVKTI